MGRLVVALDPRVNVAPADLASAWDADDEARAIGPATVETSPPSGFLNVMDLLVIPGAVGLTVNGITAMIGRLIGKIRAGPDQRELEITELTRPDGDRIVVVRLRGLPR